MKIAFITSSLEGGGAPFQVHPTVRVLRDQGHQVEVFALTLRDGKALPALKNDDFNVHVRSGGDKDHWAAFHWLKTELISYQPTLIWTSVARASLMGIILAKQLSIPVVCWQHCVYLKPITKLLYYLLRNQVTLWIGDSDVVTDVTRERFNVPAEKIATWSLFAIDPNAPLAQPWLTGQVLKIGSLGRLHVQKSYAVLIAAFAILKKKGIVLPVKFEVLIAGDGPEREALLQDILNHDCSEIKLIGYVDNPKQFLAGLHLYLQPSNREGFCIAVHEAMQAGLPVIASDTGQIPYSVNKDNGWVVPASDPTALADALIDALSKPEQLYSVGQNAREFIQPLYSQKTFEESGIKILYRLEKLINSKPSQNQIKPN